MLHELKIKPRYIEDITYYGKSFEVRKDDRPYEEGDYLWLRGWSKSDYTGEEIIAKVKYIYREELHILILSYLPDKARAQIHCDMCGMDIDIPDISKCVGVMSELVFNEK